MRKLFRIIVDSTQIFTWIILNNLNNSIQLFQLDYFLFEYKQLLFLGCFTHIFLAKTEIYLKTFRSFLKIRKQKTISF